MKNEFFIPALTLLLLACGRTAPFTPLESTFSALKGGWASQCLPAQFVDSSFKGARSTKWMFEVTGKRAETSTSLIRQQTFVDSGCTTPLATEESSGPAVLELLGENRYVLKLSPSSNLLVAHHDLAIKQFAAANIRSLNEMVEINRQTLNGQDLSLLQPGFALGLVFDGDDLSVSLPKTKQFTRNQNENQPQAQFESNIRFTKLFTSAE
jgi:hypothetical protein